MTILQSAKNEVNEAGSCTMSLVHKLPIYWMHAAANGAAQS